MEIIIHFNNNDPDRIYGSEECDDYDISDNVLYVKKNKRSIAFYHLRSIQGVDIKY